MKIDEQKFWISNLANFISRTKYYERNCLEILKFNRVIKRFIHIKILLYQFVIVSRPILYFIRLTAQFLIISTKLLT